MALLSIGSETSVLGQTLNNVSCTHSAFCFLAFMALGLSNLVHLMSELSDCVMWIWLFKLVESTGVLRMMKCDLRECLLPVEIALGILSS